MTKHICIDRILPQNRFELKNRFLNNDRSRAAYQFNKLWPNGSTLRIAFLSGTHEQKEFVKAHAMEWTKYANLTFVFDANPIDSEIRITFADEGSWSYIGKDCLSIPKDQPTMNFGWLDAAVVLHETGHMMGKIHEHQNPEGGIQWDRQAVINDLKGPPNYWDEATIEHNLFKTYDRNQLNYTQLDPQSIMLYAIPNEWTLDDFTSNFNQTLSEMDKQFAGDARNYPKAKPSPVITLPVVDAQGFAATIGQPGEEDLYMFTVKEPGRFAIETFGGLDLVMSLLGPDNQTLQITQDDDSGFALNAKIIKDLIPGQYWIQVRHYNLAKGQGEYNIRVTLL